MKEERKLIIPWKEFCQLALDGLGETYPLDENAELRVMTRHGSEPDSEIYDKPKYVEILLK